MRLIRLALRNLGRNRRRTLVAGLAVAFGAAAVVCLQGFVVGFMNNIVEVTVESKMGAIQVFRKGYLGSDDPLKHSLPEDPALMARLRAIPGVTAVAPRLDFDGMVSNGSDSTVFFATAIDPRLEYEVCPKRKSNITPGSRPLRPGAEGEVLIGQALAEAWGAKRDSTLIMQSVGPHASVNALDATIAGFLPTYSIQESKRRATVTLAFAQRLLRMDGRVNQYVVAIRNLDGLDHVAARVRAALGQEYEVTTWGDQDPATRDRVKALRFVLAMVAFVLLLLVGTGIVNTMLMSVYERVREIGTMLAVGLKRRQVTTLFLWESVALGVISAAIGTLVGGALVYWLGQRGVVFRPPGGEPLVIRPSVNAPFLAIVFGCSVLATMLAGIYPAYKASRLRPADALRAN